MGVARLAAATASDQNYGSGSLMPAICVYKVHNLYKWIGEKDIYSKLYHKSKIYSST